MRTEVGAGDNGRTENSAKEILVAMGWALALTVLMGGVVTALSSLFTL